MSGPSRMRIRHVTDYRYSDPVLSSYNEVRVTPRTGPQQVALDTRLETTPAARLRQYVDYWDTVVHVLDMHLPHDSLVIVGSAVVETGWPTEGSAGGRLTWREVADEAFADTYVETLAPTAFTAADPEVVAAAEAFRGLADPGEATDAVAEWVRGTLRYAPGITGVRTSALEAYRARSGVCQDFAHLAVAMLRTLGIPARYVSGYLHPQADGEVGHTVVGESHAWFEAFDGRTWRGLDPTNGRPVGRDHVLVATGRDYGDVAPVRGVFDGGGSSTLSVSVEITRLT